MEEDCIQLVPARDLDGCHKGVELSLCLRTRPEICRGPGIDGFYHCRDGVYQADDLLLKLLDWGLLDVFGVEVLE